MSEQPDQIRRAARQNLETDRLVGVDFVPVGGSHAAAPSSEDGPDAAKQDGLARLREEHDAECPHCTTAQGHTQTVFGEGDPDAEVMFIGEAPGAEEDRTGRPFVGRAGQKLENMITAMGLTREDVYIANILKSRPPSNRTPLPDEVAGCATYLARQIHIIEPRVIVSLGGPSTKFLLQTETGITRLRGQWAVYQDLEITVDVMPTFHPAYLLRNYTRETRERVWSDLKAVMDRLHLAPADGG